MSATALIIAGTALTAFSQVSSGFQQAELLEDEAANRRREARIAKARAGVRAGQQRREARRRRGERVSAFGSSGITLAGSPTDVLADAAMEEELGIRLTQFEGEAESARLRQEGAFAKAKAKGARTQAILGAGGTILTGAGQFGGSGGGGSGSSLASIARRRGRGRGALG